MSCRRGCITSSHARPSSTHGRTDARDLALRLLVGTLLGPSGLGSPMAVTPQGLVARFTHDVGIEYTIPEVCAAVEAEGWRLDPTSGRFNARLITTPTSRAGAALRALIAGAMNGGR